MSKLNKLLTQYIADKKDIDILNNVSTLEIAIKDIIKMQPDIQEDAMSFLEKRKAEITKGEQEICNKVKSLTERFSMNSTKLFDSEDLDLFYEYDENIIAMALYNVFVDEAKTLNISEEAFKLALTNIISFEPYELQALTEEPENMQYVYTKKLRKLKSPENIKEIAFENWHRYC